MEWAGRAVAAVGGVLALASIWLKYLSVSDFRLWDDGTYAGYVLASVVVTIALLGVAMLTRRRGFSLAAAVVALVACGVLVSTPIEFAFNQLQYGRAGFWLGTAGGLLLGAGALTAYLGEGSIQAYSFEQSATLPVPTPTAPPATLASRSPEPMQPPHQVPTIPAGWYPDPSGEAAQRYWDGRSWTAETSR